MYHCSHPAHSTAYLFSQFTTRPSYTPNELRFSFSSFAHQILMYSIVLSFSFYPRLFTQKLEKLETDSTVHNYSLSKMSFRLSISPVDLRRSKSHRATHSTSHPSKQHPETSSPKEKPLLTTPKISTVILHHLTPQRRRDSIALPRVIERWNRGIARVRQHSLIAGGTYSEIPLYFSIPVIQFPIVEESKINMYICT
ncbi:hypothetical protein H4I96_11042 [Botrytis cinerea]